MSAEESAKSAPAKNCITDVIAKQTSTACRPNDHVEFLPLELSLHFYCTCGRLDF